MAVITVRRNGPYRIQGPITLQDHEGNPIPLPGEVFSLCRCGHSKTKPFCDGTHKTIGFVDPQPPASASEASASSGGPQT